MWLRDFQAEETQLTSPFTYLIAASNEKINLLFINVKEMSRKA